ncbi:NUDIX hydrolase [Candidatus Saccharibacteria bacterium]|nr:NUDIX hydrolase [Candidatus Saccharibacteria bacterium]
MLTRIKQVALSFTPARYLRGTKYVGAGAVIFDPGGKVLLIKNRLRNSWEYPAGGSDGKESPLETCRREVGEEVGLHLAHYRLIAVDFWHKLTPNGNLLFTFAADVSAEVAATVTPQKLEVSDWRWATRAEAMELIAPRLRPRLVELFDAYDTDKPVYLNTGHPVI